MDIPGKYDLLLEQMARDSDKRLEYLYGDTGLPGRLTRLEAQTEHLGADMGVLNAAIDGLDTRLRGVEGEIKTLAERVAHVPSKGFIVLTVMTGFTLVAAVFGFQDQIVSLFTRP